MDQRGFGHRKLLLLGPQLTRDVRAQRPVLKQTVLELPWGQRLLEVSVGQVIQINDAKVDQLQRQKRAGELGAWACEWEARVLRTLMG